MEKKSVYFILYITEAKYKKRRNNMVTESLLLLTSPVLLASSPHLLKTPAPGSQSPPLYRYHHSQ